MIAELDSKLNLYLPLLTMKIQYQMDVDLMKKPFKLPELPVISAHHNVLLVTDVHLICQLEIPPPQLVLYKPPQELNIVLWSVTLQATKTNEEPEPVNLCKELDYVLIMTLVIKPWSDNKLNLSLPLLIMKIQYQMDVDLMKKPYKLPELPVISAHQNVPDYLKPNVHLICQLEILPPQLVLYKPLQEVNIVLWSVILQVKLTNVEPELVNLFKELDYVLIMTQVIKPWSNNKLI